MEHPRITRQKERERAFSALWAGFPARTNEVIKGLNALATDIRLRVLNYLEVYGIESVDFTINTDQNLEIAGEDACPEQIETVLRDLSTTLPRIRYDAGFINSSAGGHYICQNHLVLQPTQGSLHHPDRKEIVAFENLKPENAIPTLKRLSQLRQISTIEAIRYDELEQPFEEVPYRGASLANASGRSGVSRRIEQFVDDTATQITDLPHCDILLTPTDLQLDSSFQSHQKGPGNIGQIIFHDHANQT